MKITVYAIAKNEEKFVESWMQSMSEADEVVVLDTGSTDNTIEKLRSLGAKVETETITPWRFDVARNKSMELIPPDTDVCVCTDLDERFEKGWRKKLESAWQKDAKQYRYRYTWSFNADGSEGVVFWIEKIHVYGQFKWTHPVHEVLEYTGKEEYSAKFADGVQLNHYPDDAKSRSSYLPLLEMSVQESPDDDRNMHYLGREYMFVKQYTKAVETLKRHLEMKSATWKDERCASMRYIGRCLLAQSDCDGVEKTQKQYLLTEAENWFIKAVAEAPYLREPYIDVAKFYYSVKDWYGVIYFCKKALKITSRSLSYVNEPICWGDYPYDVLSLAYFFTGNAELAVETVDEAIAVSNDARLKQNRIFFENAIKK